MKAYPLIYSRTKNQDFVPDFLVRPKDLDWQSALKYVRNAMNNLDFVQNIRYTVFSVNQYCICGGISCISSRLVDRLKALSPRFATDYPEAAEYIKDCKGRVIACFIGIAIPKSEFREGMIPDVPLEKYWEIYLEYLRHQWLKENSTVSEQLEFPPINDIREKRYVNLGQPRKEVFGSRSIITDYSAHEQRILDYFFHAVLYGGDESFITEIQSREEWDSLCFKSAAVTEPLYSALKAKPVSEQNVKHSSLATGANADKPGEVTIKRTPRPALDSDTAQKKRVPLGMILVIAAVILLIIAIMILRKEPQNNLSSGMRSKTEARIWSGRDLI